MDLFGWFSHNENIESEDKQKRETDFSNFTKVADFIYDKSGITELDKRALTSSRLQHYALTQDIYTTDEFLSRMENDNFFYQEIINISTVNETFFFREVKELEWLINYIKDEDRFLKILSMPSSSGEEIYSILLMLYENGVDLNRVEITGYDISSEAVSHAINGEYDEHSLHKVDRDLREKYFTKIGDDLYKISSKFIGRAKFYQQNIFDLTNEQNSYDIVLSRNMFIYFDEQKRKVALDIIVDILKKDGIYIKGHADYIYKHPKLESVCYGIYRKN